LKSGNISQSITLDISKKTSSSIFQKNSNGTYELSLECRKLISKCSDFESVSNKLTKLATGNNRLKITSGGRRKRSSGRKRKVSPSSSESNVKKKKTKNLGEDQ